MNDTKPTQDKQNQGNVADQNHKDIQSKGGQAQYGSFNQLGQKPKLTEEEKRKQDALADDSE